MLCILSQFRLCHRTMFYTVLNGISLLKPSPRCAERLKEPEMMEDTRGAKLSKSTEQGSSELTKTGAASTGPTWVYIRSFAYML